MTTAAVVDLIRTAFLTAFWLSAPILATAFIVGIVMSLAQILTSIQDASFASVPRLLTFLVALLLALPWMLAKLMSYTTLLFGDLGKFSH
jgi:flagellar biosynthetic protein FliQ